MTEKIEIIFENDKIRVERICSFGVVSEEGFWYNNNCDEWVSITKGNAILRMENDKLRLKEGENYYIRAGVRHRVEFTSEDCEWLCVYIKG